MEGRIFIQFISLLITTRLKQVMNEAGWFKDYDLQELLNEMKTIHTVSIQGSRKRYTTELTPFQKCISQRHRTGKNALSCQWERGQKMDATLPELEPSA
ncbi:MAG: hypothetical protein K2N73_03590 [Lachnospiraceae bacterium]|nr:hypothetical protein [Lachnospiraceae bacterium]